jgi:Bacterial Ig-like domain (group 3)/FG-GAP-like repeat
MTRRFAPKFQTLSLIALFLAGLGAFTVVAAPAIAQNPVPFIDQPLVPDAIAPGGAGFTLTVNGAGFVSSSTVNWNGSPLTTTFINSGKLTAAVPAADIATASTATVTVVSPGPGGGASNPLFFSTAASEASLAFLPAAIYETHGTYGDGVAVADLRGNGKLDIVAGDICSGGCGGGVGLANVFLGNGNGTFQYSASYDTGNYGLDSVAIADMTGSGVPDIVAGDYYFDNVGVLLGLGNGMFGPAVQTYPFGDGVSDERIFVAAADVNGDGIRDVLLAVGGSLGVLLGKGNGTFQPIVLYSSDGSVATGIAVADVNNDGKLDVLITNGAGESNGDGEVVVMLGNGDGTFQPAVPYDSGGSGATSVAVADVNGDGKPDLLVTNNASESNGDGELSVLLGNGDGTFQPAVPYDSGGSEATSVAIADVNGDGKPDAVIANQAGESDGDGSASVLLGNGDGTFQPALIFDSGAWGSNSVAVADLNGDGRLDLVLASFSNPMSVLLNNTGPHTSTTTTLVSSLNPSLVDQVVTFTATVSSTGGTPQNGELVTFKNGSAVLGTGAISGGIASFRTASLPWGTSNITASYPGDTSLSPSTSAALQQLVNPNPSFRYSSSTAVRSSLSPSMYGQAITFTATVTSSGGAIPNGEVVTFDDGSKDIGTGALSNGVATFTTSSLSAEMHTIRAKYAGDPVFKSSSGAVTQVVAKYATTTTLASTLNPSNYGQAVTFKATVSATGPNPLTATVLFKDGTLAIGTVALSGGVATLAKPKLTVGANSITATYRGDTFNGESVSAAITQNVSQASLSMVLTSTPNPSTFGKSVKFTATLISNGGFPSGQSVTFSYNNATLGTAVVNSAGVATFSTTALPQGSDVVTAAYAGSVDYSSASANVTQVVN